MLHGRESWLFALVARLLDKNAKERPWLDLLDTTTSAALLRENYETKYLTPLYAKVDMYRYRMAAPLWDILPQYIMKGDTNKVIWWNRTFEEVLIPPVELNVERNLLTRVILPE
jgi:hypothetical protein